MNWNEVDYIVAGGLLVLAVAGLLIILKAKHTLKKLGGGLIILAAAWLYVELAVGLFTNWGS
jgi:hypothetical protein